MKLSGLNSLPSLELFFMTSIVLGSRSICKLFITSEYRIRARSQLEDPGRCAETNRTFSEHISFRMPRRLFNDISEQTGQRNADRNENPFETFETSPPLHRPSHPPSRRRKKLTEYIDLVNLILIRSLPVTVPIQPMLCQKGIPERGSDLVSGLATSPRERGLRMLQSGGAPAEDVDKGARLTRRRE